MIKEPDDHRTRHAQLLILSCLFLEIYIHLEASKNGALIYSFRVISKLQTVKHHSCCLAYDSSNGAIGKMDEFSGAYNYDLQKLLSVAFVKCFLGPELHVC